MKRRSQRRAFPVSVAVGRKEYVGSYEIVRGKFPSIHVFFSGRRKRTPLGPQEAVVLARTLLKDLIRSAACLWIQAELADYPLSLLGSQI